MLKAKLVWTAGILMMMALIFAGCPVDPDDNGNGQQPTPVTDLAITVPGGVTSLAFSRTGSDPFSPSSVQLGVTFTPANATNQAVTWSAVPAGVVTVSATGLVTPAAALTAGTHNATVKVASNENPTSIFDIILVTVTVSGGGGTSEPGTGELVIYNQAASPASGTTTVMPARDANDRYIISNTYSVTGQAAGYYNNDTNNPVSVRNATFIYLDTPLSGAASVTARVKLTAMTGGAGNNSGIVMGMVNDPKSSVIKFAGIRLNTNGSSRPYYSNDSNEQNSAGTDFGLSDSYTTEYILEVTRSSATAYVFRIKNQDGTEIGTMTRSSGILAIDPAYIGFIIARAAVEISEIAITDAAGDVVFSSPGPGAIEPQSVEFTAPAGVAGSFPNYTYSHSIYGGSNTLALSAKALPANAPQDIDWEISGDGSPSLDTDTGASVTATLPSAGTVTVTAAAGSKTATLTITVTDDAVQVDSITISAGKTSIMAGDGGSVPAETLQFTESVLPSDAANKTVVWSVSSTNSYSADTSTSVGSIDADTGLLTALTPGSIWVFAAAVDGSGAKSAGTEITVKAYSVLPSEPQIWRTDVGAANGTVAVSSDGTTLTMKGTGTINTTGQVFNFVYLPVANEDFTITVKIKSLNFGSTNNAARIGIIAFPQAGITQNTTTGVLTNIPTGNNLLYAGMAARGDNTWHRIQRTTVGSNSGTSNLSGGVRTPPDAYLRLRRVGSDYYAGSSADGTSWVEASSTAPALGASYAGLEVSGASATATAEFEQLRFRSGNGAGGTNTQNTGGINLTASDDVSFEWFE